MDTISEGHIKGNKILHASAEGYGGRGNKWIVESIYWAGVLGAKTILDYGCGQRSYSSDWTRHHKSRNYSIVNIIDYDPAVEGYENNRTEVDMVNCTDVLEHIEPQYLDNVFKDLKTLGRLGAFLVIATRPANKFLPDGRNAHLIIQPMEWWIDKIHEYWGYASVTVVSDGEFIARVKPK